MKKILIIFCCCFLVFPLSAFASITEHSFIEDKYLLTDDEFVATIPAGSTGTFYLKTPSGSTSFSYRGYRFEDLNFVDDATIRGSGTSIPDALLTIVSGSNSARLSNWGNNFGFPDFLNDHVVSSFSVKITVTDLRFDLHVWLKAMTVDSSGTGGISNPDFPVQWNNTTRRITWVSYPSSTYEIIVTDPDGVTYNIVPSTRVFKIESDSGGRYTLQARTLNGDVITSTSIDVPAADLGSGGGSDNENPNPDPGSNPDDPNNSDGTCFCEPVCQILPEILADFGSNLNGIRGELENLNGQMAPIHDALGRIWDATDTLHRDNLRMEVVMTQIESHVAPLHGDLLVIQSQLSEVLWQIRPQRIYNTPSPVSVPDYYQPGEATPIYTNNQIYFTDQGDAAVPDAMPAAPEPESWEFEGHRLTEDAVINQSPNQQQDEFMQRGDEMTQDDVMQREDEMTQDDVLQREDEMTQDDVLQLDSELQRMPELNMTTPLQMQDNYYPLRWDSSEYVR
ncbi:hypothetical protein D3C76_316260 [compost metagenome]